MGTTYFTISDKWEPHSRGATCIYIYFSLDIYACSSSTMWFPFIATEKNTHAAVHVATKSQMDPNHIRYQFDQVM